MYSMDFKKRAAAYKNGGHMFEQLREDFGMPNQTPYLWKRNLESGYYQAKGKKERKRKIGKEQLARAAAERPDAYLHEPADPFGCSGQAAPAALKKMCIALKKSFTHGGKSEAGREAHLKRVAGFR